MIFKFYRASSFVGMIGKKPSQESLDCQTEQNKISKMHIRFSNLKYFLKIFTYEQKRVRVGIFFDSDEFSEFIPFERLTESTKLSGAKLSKALESIDTISSNYHN